MAWYSQTWTWFEGKWIEGNPPLTGPRSQAFWLGSSVFDGARVFEGVTPDIDRHAERVNNSATKLGMKPTMQAAEIVRLVREGAKKFNKDDALYVRPMYWAERDGIGAVVPDPDSTRFCLCLYVAPMPEPTGATLTVSKFRRPTLETMPTDVKTGALYPNNARMIRDAVSRGFTNALVLDMLGNVAETGSSNIFMAKGGVLYTPAVNGTFLNGITRQRVVKLMRAKGVEVVESVLRVEDFMGADEMFTVGNYSKVGPVTQLEAKEMQPGPLYRQARAAYWEFAHSGEWAV